MGKFRINKRVLIWIGISIAAVILIGAVILYAVSDRDATQVNEPVESASSDSLLGFGESSVPTEIVSQMEKELFPTADMRLLWTDGEITDIGNYFENVKEYGFTGVVVNNIDALEAISQIETELTVYFNLEIDATEEFETTAVQIADEYEVAGIFTDGDKLNDTVIKSTHDSIRALNKPVAFGVTVDGQDAEAAIAFIDNEYIDFIAPKIDEDTQVELWVEQVKNKKIALIFIHDGNEGEDKNKLVTETEEISAKAGYRGSIYCCDKEFEFNEYIAELAKYWQGDDFIALKKLKLIEPTATEIITYDTALTLRLEYNRENDLLINGEKVTADQSGSLMYAVDLDIGLNDITIKNGEDIIVISAKRAITVIQRVSPQKNVTEDGGIVIELTANALPDSKVTANINGQTLTMTKQESQEESFDFAVFATSFRLPDATEEKQDLGKITFKGTYSGYTQTVVGGRVYVNEAPAVDENEIRMVTVKVERNAENKKYGVTYPPEYADDTSAPTQYLLPKGSVDYVVDELDKVIDGVQKSYYILSCGEMIYKSDCNLEFVAEKQINSVKTGEMSADRRYSTLTLDMSMPVAVIPALTPLKFLDSHGPYGYKISSFDSKRIEFLFSNTVKTCDIQNLTSSPLFSSYEWQKVNDTQVKLILNFKQGGRFHGFSTYFNEEGKFVIRFKNTIAATVADNEYGYSLEGIRITLDAGHNGRYPYGSGADGYDGKLCEAEINLQYAKLIKEELEALGATVLLTRSENNVTMSEDERVQKIRETECDAMIAIHQNGSEKESEYGTSTYYFYPYAQPLAAEINKALVETYRNNIYTSGKRYNGCDGGCMYYPYYMTRIQEFPCVLIETGYITNEQEYYVLTDSEYQKLLAKAYVKGIVNYFASLD